MTNKKIIKRYRKIRRHNLNDVKITRLLIQRLLKKYGVQYQWITDQYTTRDMLYVFPIDFAVEQQSVEVHAPSEHILNETFALVRDIYNHTSLQPGDLFFNEHKNNEYNRFVVAHYPAFSKDDELTFIEAQMDVSDLILRIHINELTEDVLDIPEYQ